MPYKLGRKEYMRQYRQRPHVKEKDKAYRSTDEYKKRHKVYQEKYAKTHAETIMAKNNKWNASAAAKKSKAIYRAKKRQQARETFNIIEFAKNMYRHRAEITRRRKDEWLTGDSLITKEEFVQFCKDNEDELLVLWTNWKESGFQRKLTPSLDRIDNNKGYVKGNLQFMTLFQNQQKYWEGC